MRELKICSALLLLVLALPAQSAPKTGRDWAKEAEDAQQGVDSEDVGTVPEDQPQEASDAQVGGCRQRTPGKMSLLGVEYDGGGASIPKGEIRSLRDDDPAIITLAGKTTVIRDLEDAERKQSAEAFAWLDQPSWNTVTTWSDGVGRIRGRTESAEARIKEQRRLIGINENWAKGSQEDLAKAKDADQRERAQLALDFYKKEIQTYETVIAEAQKELATYEQKLPAMLHGLAKHSKAMAPARAAYAQAEKVAKQRAAQCP